jgi:hypothetical protein
MKRCIYYGCSETPEFHHAFTYAGKQINEAWAILPVCEEHHRGVGFENNYCQYRALLRADINELQKRLFKKNWLQTFKYLNSLYGTNDGGRIQQVG